MNFTAGLYGHSNPVIRAAIDRALDDGISLSGHNLLESRLADLIRERIRSIASLRFTNSGTEANLMALAAAKAFTGRSKVIVFVGGYHGGVLTFGSGPAKVNVPHDYLYATYNDAAAVDALFDAHGTEIAAVLVEPMQGSSGCIVGEPAFLQRLRERSAAAGALLIFDEVMTSRLAPGGRQSQLGITPDLTTLGKYIGGGMSFGAFGGRRDVMAQFDPRTPGALTHAGTFNNNVLTMSAGAAGLGSVYTDEAALTLNARGDAIAHAAERDLPRGRGRPAVQRARLADELPGDGCNAAQRRRPAGDRPAHQGSAVLLHGRARHLPRAARLRRAVAADHRCARRPLRRRIRRIRRHASRAALKASDAKPALNREHILATALALIDRDGCAALSLRVLAKELGVFPTAIYWHVPNRNELVAGAVALALHGVGDRLPGGTWQHRLRALLKRFRAALHRHPKLAPVVGTELISNIPLDLPMLEHIVRALEDAGFDGPALVDAFNVVVAAMCGFVTIELAAAPAEHADAWAQSHEQALREIPAPAYPALAGHLPRLRDKAFILRWTSGASRPLDSAFEAWLDVIIGGLERRAMSSP